MHDNHSPVALVTGAAKRIGKQLAITLHTAGYRVIIHYNQSCNDAEALASQLNDISPNSAATVGGSLIHTDAIQQVATDALSAFKRLDILINNASAFYPTEVTKATPDDWQQLMGSNAKGPYFLTQALLSALQQNHGQIINMIDMHVDRPLPNHSIYCMAKSALKTMTKALALEFAPHIRVNGIAPGAILWPERPLADDQQQALLNSIPAKRLGSVEDIAQTALFLINANYVTGQIIYVDGGRSLVPNAQDC